MSENVKKWYVVRAISGQEKKVRDYIELEVRRNKMEDLVSQILVPMEKVKKQSKKEAYIPDTFFLKRLWWVSYPTWLKTRRV